MSVLKNNLRKDEIVIGEASIHWGVFIPPIIWSFFFLLFSHRISTLFIVILFFFPAISKYFFTELSLSNKRLVGKIGIIKTISLDNPLNKINSISISNGLFGKLFGYGDICVNTGGYTMVFHGIRNPQEFSNLINSQLNR